MKTIIFIISLITIGFIVGQNSMWGEWNEAEKEIERAPYTHGFEGLKWTAQAIAYENKDLEVNPIISNLINQAEGVNKFFSERKERRLEERRFLLLWGQALIAILGIIAYLTYPKKNPPPVTK